MRIEIGDRGSGASEPPRSCGPLAEGRPGPPWPRGHASVRIRSRGFRLTEALRAFTERRLRRAIPGRLRSVMVRLDDVNGPRGGSDKRCQIVAQLVPRGDVRVQERNEDLYTAISRAARRLERAVTRAAGRRQWTRGFQDTLGLGIGHAASTPATAVDGAVERARDAVSRELARRRGLPDSRSLAFRLE